jgi:hypothetical protein
MLLSLLPPTTSRYERLLQKTSHVKVWISYADFEASLDDDAAAEQARHVYETAEKEVKKGGDKAQRLLLLESWRDFEADLGALFVVAPTPHQATLTLVFYIYPLLTNSNHGPC